MKEHHLGVQRTARYYTLEPEEEPQEVWFVLHGYGQLAQYFLRHFEAVQNGRRLIVAPEALSRHYLPGHQRVGASWMTKEDRVAEVADYLAYLDALHDRIFERVDRRRVTVHVLGFSQGGATASRWTTLGRIDADRLILWASDVPPDLDLPAHATAIGRRALTLVVGTRDEYVTPALLAEQEALLTGHQIPYRLHTFAGTHTIDPDTLMVLAGN
ncbi:MAG: phospholipase [Acidobacteria bacterium]|nr:phospholipase [Acidobacteriota bacterium]